MENNNLDFAMLDIPGLSAESLHFRSLLRRTNAYLWSSIRTLRQQEQLSDDWYAFYTRMIGIKRVLLERPYQTRAIKKALEKVNKYLTITECCSYAVIIEL